MLHRVLRTSTSSMTRQLSSYSSSPIYAAARDFRSDTITIPVDEMFERMKNASRGDDVYEEDTSTISLQNTVAAMTGKESGLYCVSGTMTNQLAIRCHLTQPPYSVLCDARAHVHKNEAGGIAHHSQATTNTAQPSNGIHLTLEDISPALEITEDIHRAPTKLICLENTLNGTILPQEEVIRIGQKAKELGIPLHLDGARIWDVSAKTGLSLEQLCEPFDTVSLCLSKGLGAPIGSVLVGPKELIKKAKWFRKMFGGGVRQCGSMAEAAQYCIENHFNKLPDVHRKATKLSKGLHDLGFNIILPTQTNMVFIDTRFLDCTLAELQELLREDADIRVGLGKYPRIVLHHQITDDAIEDFLRVASNLVAKTGTSKVPDKSHPLRMLSTTHLNGDISARKVSENDDIGTY